jgi:hypothetical protein
MGPVADENHLDAPLPSLQGGENGLSAFQVFH